MANNFINKIKNLFSETKYATVIILGLDNSGKTTIVNKIKGIKNKATDPTIGETFSVVNIQNFKVTLIDVAGSTNYRQNWETHYSKINAAVFVFDCEDTERIELMAYEYELFITALKKINKKNIILTFFLNKTDKGNIELEYIMKLLKLDKCGYKWNIFKTDGLKGTNIIEGFDWVVGELNKLSNF